jgi:hypothetical protein
VAAKVYIDTKFLARCLWRAAKRSQLIVRVLTRSLVLDAILANACFA